jgi:hypothetical protein
MICVSLTLQITLGQKPSEMETKTLFVIIYSNHHINLLIVYSYCDITYSK